MFRFTLSSGLYRGGGLLKGFQLYSVLQTFRQSNVFQMYFIDTIQYNTITLFALNIYMFLAHNKLIGIEKCFQRKVYMIDRSMKLYKNANM